MGTSKYSRIVTHDLTQELEGLRREGTAFLPHRVVIERSGRYNFLDEPFVESISFGEFACPGDVDNFSPLLGGNTTKAGVNYEVDSDLSRFCAIANEDHAWTVSLCIQPPPPRPSPTRATLQVYNSRELCGEVKLSGEPQVGLHFEPKCMYVVVASSSRSDLFNEMMVRSSPPLCAVLSADHVSRRRPRAGSSPIRSTSRCARPPCRLTLHGSDAFPTGQVEYTVATNEDPDPRAAFINCQSSFVLQDAYERDRVLQDELQELEDLRIEYEMYDRLLAFWDHILKMRKLGTPPEPPPPPPPPPPYPAFPGTSLLVGPPAPPKMVTPEEQTQQYVDKQSEIALRITDLIDLIGSCVPSATTTCGLPANEVRRVGGFAAVRPSNNHDCTPTQFRTLYHRSPLLHGRVCGLLSACLLSIVHTSTFTPLCSDGGGGCSGGCAFYLNWSREEVMCPSPHHSRHKHPSLPVRPPTHGSQSTGSAAATRRAARRRSTSAGTGTRAPTPRAPTRRRGASCSTRGRSASTSLARC